MKKKIWFAVLGLCLIIGLAVSVVCLQTAKTKAEAAADDAVSADITVVKYRTVAGIMQYRRWNETKGKWIDKDWVDFTEKACTPEPTKVPTPTKVLQENSTYTPTGKPTNAPINNGTTPTGKPTDTLVNGTTPTAKPTNTSVPTKAPTRKPTNVPTPTSVLAQGQNGGASGGYVAGVTPMPEQKVGKADPSVNLVPVDAAHFSDENFRNYLLLVWDKDADGFLSAEERKSLVTLDWNGSELWEAGKWKPGVTVLDGLDWFPNLKSIGWSEDCILYAKDLPSLVYICAGEAGGECWAENCEKLEYMSFGMYEGSVHVTNCKNLIYVDGTENCFREMYFAGTPSLVLADDGTSSYPAEIVMDANAVLAIERGENNGVRGERILPTDAGVAFGYDGSIKVKWLGTEAAFAEPTEDFEKMRAMQEEAVLERIAEKFSTEDTPEKREEFYAVWYNPNQTSVFACRTGLWVNYTENGQTKQSDVVEVVHYFVREPNGVLTMFDSCREAFYSLRMYNVYEDVFNLDLNEILPELMGRKDS